MPRTPLSQRQAEEVLARWLVDQLPVPDPASRPDPTDVAGWLAWHESDLAFIADVDMPVELVEQLGSVTVRLPRVDVGAGDAGSTGGEGDGIRRAPVDPARLRLLVDRHTAEVVAADPGEPVPHVLELWREAKGVDGEAAWVPGYEPPPEEGEGA